MTKKHFIQLADTIKAQRPNPENAKKGTSIRDFIDGQLTQWEQMRDAIANFCQAQNPNFNRQRWLDYIEGKCGPNGGKIKG